MPFSGIVKLDITHGTSHNVITLEDFGKGEK